MKINDYHVGTTFTVNCVKDGDSYKDFEITPKSAFLYGVKKEDIIQVEATIIEEDVIIADLYKKGYDAHQIDYFGYIEFCKDGTYSISMIYCNVIMYNICFPCGADCTRISDRDYTDVQGNKIHKGDRLAMTVRLKIKEL